ncbi:MAG TPA: hypothetical protein ENN61_00480 [Bacteroidaceae bacterium]|nr:hypothetical protein [Bacteroidaceae bacterium]
MISDLLFITIALVIAAILGFLVGYFLCRRKAAVKETLNEPIESVKEEVIPDENKQTAFQEISRETGQDIEAPEFDPEAAKAVLGKNIALDDLKIIEGIGPVIEGILKKNHIGTWEKLAGSEPENIGSILIAEGGNRYRIHDPGTWPEQAGLAFHRKWEELKKLQDELSGGRKRG